jgi:hypothetical protein
MIFGTLRRVGSVCKARIFITVAQLLGHKDLRMAARYQHLSPAFLADAVARLDSVLAFHHSVTTIRELETTDRISA